MTATIAEVTISATEFALSETFAEFNDVRFEVERVVAQDDRITPLVWVTHEESEAVEAVLEVDSSTASVEVLVALDGERLYRMEWVDRVEALVYVLVEEEGAVLSASGENGQWVLRLLFADRGALGRTYDHCGDVGLDFSVERVFNIDEGRQGRLGLTDKQRDVLRLAFEYGYYDIPRKTSAQDLADEMAISHQALSERLRRAHRAVVANTVILGHDGEREQRSPL